ncbi:MAG: L,D-transpeptidase [Deltaproteobacteria bacterium]|nr:L,D-transpeptidase [Deltaproteobacteria bacterium]
MKTISLFLLALWFCLLPARRGFAASKRPDLSWTLRTVTETELVNLGMAKRAPGLNECLNILSKLNTQEPYYILKDMRQGKKLKVPDDFNAYRHWTPLPARLPEKFRAPEFIMMVKDLGFIGWYDHGELVGDSQACIGRRGQNTIDGLYRVDEKDAHHTSSLYHNDYGRPAWMPYSLHIYGAVWIHAGNVFGLHCSHGCITLPIGKAEKLFKWAQKGTPVLVTDNLKNVCGPKKASELLNSLSDPRKSSDR